MRFCALVLVLGFPAALKAQTDASSTAKGALEDIADDDDFGDDEVDDLLDMADKDVGQLSNVQVAKASVAPALDTAVSTVERKSSTVGKTPAAVFVITNEMIRRSGARSIPEVLRMAPGVNVARIDGNKWAVSIRGFNGRFANKLLVQIDGRSVYNPLFGGVYWDVQNVVLEDVAQIEVIRGPGGAVWGANAVNGVINIVTKDASKTRGTFAEAGGGNIEGGYSSFRHGRAIASDADMRVFGQWFDRNTLSSVTEHDDSRNLRIGSRLDWRPNSVEHMTIQGDYYRGSGGTASRFASPTPPPPITIFDEEVEGGNLLYRWSHQHRDQTGWSFQAYVESTDRQLIGAGAGYNRQTIDLDYQRSIKPFRFHDVIYGISYRHTWDRFTPQDYFLTLHPARSSYDNASAFLQDTMTLVDDRWYLSLGAKISHNDFSGGEIQPSARLLWTKDERTSLWGSVSRAVRTPTRLLRDARLVLPSFAVGPANIYPVVFGRNNFEAEDILAWEFGMRRQASDDFAWDLALFHNTYKDLSGIVPIGGVTLGTEGLIVPQSFANNASGTAWGGELATTVSMTENWSLRSAYSYLHLNIDGTQLTQDGDSPQNQLYLQSTHDLGGEVELDLIYRYVDTLPDQQISDYNVMDIRLGWRPNQTLEVYAVGQNLFDADRREYGDDAFAGTQSTAVPRGVYGGFSLRY